MVVARVVLTVLFVSLAGALLYLASHDWFGAGDLSAFVVWSAAFAAYLVAAGRRLVGVLRTRRHRTRLVLAALSGLGLGFLWTVALALLLPWFGAFSFPVLYFWLAAGAAGLLVLAHASSTRDGVSAATNRRGGHRLWRPVLYVAALPLVTIVAVIALGLLYTAGSAFMWDRGEPEVHLLPAGYVGHVSILYGLPDGEPVAYDDRRRVYRVGPDGVLRSQFARNRGTWWPADFFYVTADGQRQEITERWNSTIADTPENRADTATVGIYFQHSGLHAPGTPGCEVQTSGYYVGTKADVLADRGPDALHEHLKARPLPCDRRRATEADHDQSERSAPDA